MRLDRAGRLRRTADAQAATLDRRGLSPAADLSLYASLGLLAVWVLVLAGAAPLLPLQWASWLTFLAIAIMPGFLLADMLCWRLDLDLLQRLALAFPLSIVVMTPPGLAALLGHLTLSQLALGWGATTALVAVAWGAVRLRRRGAGHETSTPWTRDEVVLLVILSAAYIAMFPLLSLYKMDGDAYAVLSFTADALTGAPLNVTEPLLGTGYNPNVRMAGNQMLPVFHLWCYLAGADHVELVGSASRSMLALWALLSTYALGREAGDGRRRIGLLAVGIQVLVYLAAPFYRGDSVSVFFFERTNADKFTVSITMLPVTLGLAVRYIRLGERATWLAAALCAFAVSAVHALIAAILALGLASFAALYLLLHLRRLVAWKRVAALAVVATIGMGIPMAQYVMTLDTPLAPTYPQSLDGWRIGERTFRLLPSIEIKGLDLYGPLPSLAEVRAEDANTDTNPFLIWRFAANMRRKRLIVFDLHRYISDPGLVLEPPYLLALLLLPLLLWRLPSRPGAQMAVANSLAVLALLFNPVLTPMVGAMAVPWLLWRFMWLLPYAVAIALVVDRVLGLLARLSSGVVRRDVVRGTSRGWLGLTALVVCGLLLWPRIAVTSRELRSRPPGPVAYPTPRHLFARLDVETHDAPAMVLADENLSVTIPAYVGNAHVMAREVLTSEFFPADAQDKALQRHIDQYRFFHTPLLTAQSVDILRRNAVGYVVAASGSDLDLQMRAASQWFRWLIDDQGYSLHAVHGMPSVTGAVEANTLMADRRWDAAAERYRAALAQDPNDLLAAVGLARASRLQGLFDPAIDVLRAAASEHGSPVAHFYLGRLHAERGEFEPAIATLSAAVHDAPWVPRFHATLGSACLAAGRVECAEEHLTAAVDARGPRDEAWRLITLAGLWDQEGETERAAALYDQAIAYGADWPTRLLVASAYQSMGEYARAEALLLGLLRDSPSSVDARVAMASLRSAQGEGAQAIPLLREALALQAWQGQDTDLIHLSLAQILLRAGHTDEARLEIDRALELRPYSAAAHNLLGNLRREQGEAAEAVAAYRRALEIDPRQVAPYIALGEAYLQASGSAQEALDLLAARIAENPPSARMYLYLGDHLQRQGDAPAAIAAYHLAVNLLQPDTIATGIVDRSRVYGRAAAYARLAATYEDQAQPEAAISYYRAAAAASQEPRYCVLLGNALRTRGEMSAAAAAYGAAIDRDPTYVDGYIQLADLMQAQGDTPGALAQRERAAQAIASAAQVQPALAAPATGRYDLTAQQPGVQRGSDEALAIAAAAHSAILLALDPSGESGDAPGGLAALSGLARLYLDSGQVDLAIQVYLDEIAYGEIHGWAASRLARHHANVGSLYLQTGHPDDALQAFGRATELDVWSPAAHVGMGRALARMGRESEALELFRLAVSMAPGIPEAQLALALALERSGASEESRGIYQSVVDSHPGNVPAARSLGRAWLGRREWQLAEESLRRAIAAAPGKPEAYVDLATVYAAQARYVEAEGALRSAIQLNHDDTRALLHFGDLMARLGHHRESIDAYGKALASSPTDWRPYLGLAEVHRALGETDAAMERLRQAATVDTTATGPLLRLATLYTEQNRPTDAEDVLALALERTPGDVTVRQARARYYQARGLSDQALAEWRQAVGENPSSVVVLTGYAGELGRQGRLTEAEEVLRHVEASGPTSAMDCRLIAQAYDALGDTDRAREWFRVATAASSVDAAVWLAQGQMLTLRGDMEGALASAREATRLAPAEGRAWHGLGESLLAMGHLDEAVAALERARASEPTFVPTYEPLMRAYLALGDPSEARRTVGAARAVAPGSYRVDLLAAEYAESQGDAGGARQALKDAVSRAPGVPEPYLRSADALMRQGLFVEAAAVGDEAARIWPADWRFIIASARLDVAQGRTHEAVARLEAITRASVQEPTPWIELATLYRDQNQPARAQALLRRALSEISASAAIRLELADLYQSMARPDEAFEELRLAAEEHPQDIQALLAYAEALRLRGDTASAETLYRQAEGIPGAAASAYRRIAIAYEDRGERQEGLAWLERAITRWPGDPANWVAHGQMLARAGQGEAALDSLRRGTQLNPLQAEAWHALAVALLDMGQDVEGRDTLQHAIRVEPSYLASYGTLMDHYLDRGQLKAAEELAIAASQLVPGSYQGDLYVARALRHQGRSDEASQVLQGAVAKAPGVPAPRIALGELAFLQGSAEQAIAAYELALAVRPGSPAAALGLADLLLHIGDNQRALAVARRAASASPNSVDVLLRQGRAERALGLFAEAEATFLRATAQSPSLSGPHAELGELRQTLGRVKEAILDYERAAAADPSSARHYLAQSQLWVTQGRADIALAVLYEGSTRVTESTPLRSAMSQLLVRQGDPMGALDSLRLALAEGENAELLCALGAYHEARAEFGQAEEAYRRAVELAPEDTIGHVALAALLLRRGRAHDAMAGYRQALALEPRDPALSLGLGDALRLVGDLAAAAESYRQALELSPTLIEAYSSLGSLYEAQARWQDAEALYEKALSLAPTAGRLLIQYGGLMVQRGDIDRALALLERARQVSPRAETFVARAILLRLVGRSGEAEQDLEAALQTEPGSLETLVALGDLYLAKGASGKAAEIYRHAVTLAPGAAQAHLSLAHLALRQGSLSQAWQQFGAAVQAQPAEAETWLQLAEARTDQRDLQGAESAYRQAVDVAPLISRAYAGLALVTQHRTGDRSQALAWLDRARQLGVDPALIERTTGEVYLRAGQSAQALSHFQVAAQLETALPGRLGAGPSSESNSPDGHLSLAAYQLARGLPHAALAAAKAAEAIAPRDPAVHITHGHIYQALGQTSLAEQRYRYAAVLNATKHEGYLALAAMLRAVGRHAEAIAAYQLAASRAPLDPAPLLGIGDAYADRGNLDAALAAYGRAAALNPALPDPWLRRGTVLLAQGDPSGAAVAYRRAHALRPHSAEPLVRLASLYVELGDLEQAEAHARRAVEVERRNASAHAQLGGILMRQERRDEAIASYLAAVQIDPRQVDAYDRWVRLHLDTDERPFRVDLGRLAAAVSALEQGPYRRTLWGRVLLVRGYHALEGPSDRVKAYLEEAIAVDPAYADLHRQVALLHEGRLEGRQALSAWYRYRYATYLDSDHDEISRHIGMLQRCRIDSPADGALLPGTVQITGTAARDGFQFYKVEYRAIGSDAWNCIGEPVHHPVERAPLVDFDTSALPPGEYRLRLTVVDQTGNYGPHDEITVTVGGR